MIFVLECSPLLVCLNYKNFDSMKATDCLDFFELKGVQLVGF